MDTRQQAENSHRLFSRRYAPFASCQRALLTLAGAVLICLFGLLVWSFSPAATAVLSPAVTLAAVLFMLALLLVFLWQDLIYPLMRVLHWTETLQAGDLSSRLDAPENHAGILNELYRKLNFLASMLEKQSRENNLQIEKYTWHIEAKTRVLTVLYSFAANLNAAHGYKDLAVQVVKAFYDVLHLKAALIRCVKAGKMTPIAGSGDLPKHEIESLPPDSSILKSSERHRRICVPLQNSKNERLGVMSLYLNEKQYQKRKELTELFLTIGKSLGKAIEDFHLKEQNAHLSILKDRAWLANELHDSLAQTIYSMRVRVRLLDQSLRADDPPEVVWQSVEQIERSIEEANYEVRRLIQCFSNINDVQNPGLAKSLDTIVERFRRDNPDTTVYLDRFLPRRPLPEEYEVQIMHVIRESLINVEKHGCASFVHVLIRGSEEGYYRVYIQDNGLGMGDGEGPATVKDHIGLKVMRDRAESIGGALQIKGNRGQGTSVELTFQVPADQREDGCLRE